MKVVHLYPKDIELPQYLKHKLNSLVNLAFNHDQDDYRFDMYNYDIVAVLYHNNEPVGSAFLEKHTKDVVEPLSKEFYFIHTLNIHPNYRGQKLCNFLMKEIVKKLGKLYSLFLSVDTSSQKANIPGIKCYQKCGFKLVDCLYEKRNDGTFSHMVRVKTPPKKRSSSSSTYHRSIKGRTKKGRSKYKKNKTKKYKKKKGKADKGKADKGLSVRDPNTDKSKRLEILKSQINELDEGLLFSMKTIAENAEYNQQERRDMFDSFLTDFSFRRNIERNRLIQDINTLETEIGIPISKYPEINSKLVSNFSKIMESQYHSSGASSGGGFVPEISGGASGLPILQTRGSNSGGSKPKKKSKRSIDRL